MDFRFDVGMVLRKPITIFSGQDMPRHALTHEKAVELIDEMGIASARAQKLRGPVTTTIKLRYNPDHHVYILREVIPNPPQREQLRQFKFEPLRLPGESVIGGLAGEQQNEKVVAVGMIKVGRKSLFVVDEYGRHLNINPLCVLDFYIHESFQRRGYGKKLFEYMLMLEMQSPGHLAYDRPSEKFRSFLQKHYGLTDYIPQVNNFVVFKQYGLEFLDLNIRGRSAYPQSSDNRKTDSQISNVKEVKYEPQVPVRHLRQNRQDQPTVWPLNVRTSSRGLKTGLSSRHPEEKPRSTQIENVGLNPTGNARRFDSFLGARKMSQLIEANVNESLRDKFGEEEPSTLNLNAIQEESESVYASARSSLTTPPRKEAEKTPGEFDSLSDYWQAQAQARKTRLMSISQESGRSTRSSIMNSPPTNIFSRRQQKLLSSVDDMRRGSAQYGSLQG